MGSRSTVKPTGILKEVNKMRKKRLFKFVLLSLATTFLFLVLAYHFITCSWFLTNIVLSQVGNATKMVMSAEKIHLSLWRGQLEIHNLSVGDVESPWLKAQTLTGKFDLDELFGGNIKLSDVLLDGAQVDLQKNANGNWNLTSAEKKGTQSRDKSKRKNNQKKKKSSTSPVRLELTNIKVTNSSFKLTTRTRSQSTALELSQLHLELPSFSPGVEGQLTIRSNLNIRSGSEIDVTDGVWHAHLDFLLNDRLIPEKLNLMSNVDELYGNVNGVDLADHNLALLINSVGGGDGGITINNLLLRQVHHEEFRTSISANGAIQFSPFELNLKVSAKPLAEELFAIAVGFYKGINPGRVSLRYQGEIDYRVNRLKSSGDLALVRTGNAVVGGKTLTLPQFELTSKHNIEFDFSRKILHLQHFNTEIVREQQRIVAFFAKRPCSYNWGKNSPVANASEPDLTLLINNFDLSLLHLLIVPTDNFILREGKLDAQLDCRFDQRLGGLVAEGKLTGRQISGRIGGKDVSDWSLSQQLRLQIEDFDRLVLEKSALSLQRSERPLVAVTMKGTYLMSARTGKLKLTIDKVAQDVIDVLPLSVEQCRRINEMVAVITPLELRFSGEYDFDFNQKLLAVKTSQIQALRQEQLLLTCALKPTTVNLKKIDSAQQFQIKIASANLPVSRFNGFLKRTTPITGGEFSFVGKMTTTITGDPLQLALDVSLNDVAISLADKRYKGLGAVFTTDLKLEKFRMLHINQSVLKLSTHRLAAAALNARGNLDLAAGKGEVNCRLDYLNSHLLNLFNPDQFTRTESTGLIQLKFDDGFETLAMVGNIDLAALEMKHSTIGINGNITADIKKTPTQLKYEKVFCELRQGREVALKLNAVANFPAKTANTKTNIRINADRIDLALIEKLFSDGSVSSSGETTSSVGPQTKETADDTTNSQPTGFDFGAKPFELNLDLRNITYGSDITAELKSKILGRAKEVVVNPFELKLNGRPLTARGKFVSGRSGIVYDVRAAASGIEFGPLVRPFVNDQLKNIGGLVKELTLNVKGADIQSPALWDNMNGACNLRLEKIVIPNEFGNTLIGALLLLPFEVMAKLQSLLPESVVSGGIIEVLNGVTRYRDQFKEITLSEGEIKLRAGNRRIVIDKCHFTGDFVKSLQFSGSLGLGSDTALDIESSLNVNNLIVPVKLTGTVGQPSVNYSAIVRAFLRDNTMNIVNDGVGGAIGTGAQGLQDVIQRTIEVIRTPQPEKDKNGGVERPVPMRKEDDNKKALENLLRQVL